MKNALRAYKPAAYSRRNKLTKITPPSPPPFGLVEEAHIAAIHIVRVRFERFNYFIEMGVGTVSQMLQYIDQPPEWIAYIKTANAPRFFGGAVGKREACGFHARQYFVEIINLD